MVIGVAPSNMAEKKEESDSRKSRRSVLTGTCQEQIPNNLGASTNDSSNVGSNYTLFPIFLDRHA